MTKEEILNSLEMKKLFCKLYTVPISVFSNPYFSKRLECLDVVENTISKFEDFCFRMRDFESEPPKSEYFKWQSMISKYIKSCHKYQEFKSTTWEMNTKWGEPPYKNLYDDRNDGKSFIHIKLTKDLFFVLRNYADDMFGKYETWCQLVDGLGVPDLFKLPSVQSEILSYPVFAYAKYLMDILYCHIHSNLPTASVYSVYNFEIILNVPDCGTGFSMNELRSIIDNCKQGVGKLVTVDSFLLEKTECCWVKTYNGEPSKVKFALYQDDLYPQIVAHYFGIPIEEEDLVFKYDGKLARFLQPIENPFV